MDEQPERVGREGGRWINERPTSEEFALWFKEAMDIEDGMDISKYIGGVVLIPAVDSKSKYVKEVVNGKPVIEERPELSFIPYAKVETRIAYFWDLLELKKDWVGVVERITPPRPALDPVIEAVEAIATAQGATPELAERIAQVLVGRDHKPGALTMMAHQLPAGFSVLSVPVADKFSHYLCCTIRVAIYDRVQYERNGTDAVPLRVGQGTKQVPMAKSYNSRTWADESSMMKAETGALGRALGFAGVFVIPGSGVATAEDMAEATEVGDAATSEQADAANQGPTAPESPVRTGREQAEDDDTQLKERATELWKTLTEDYPDVVDSDFRPWASQRQLRSIGDAKGAMLRGLVRKLETLLDVAKQRQEGGDDVPSQTGSEDGGAGGRLPDGDGDELPVAGGAGSGEEASDGEGG